MKKNFLILSLLFAFTSVYPTVDIVPLSPYINRGVSIDLHLSYNPMVINHYYEQKPQEYRLGNEYYYGYTAYSNIIYFIKNDWERGGYINIGFPNEKFEISAWTTITRIVAIKTRVKFKHIEKGEDKFFRNITISSFMGVIYNTYYNATSNYHGSLHTPDPANIMLYSGISLGTRKEIDEFSYFEIFTNPYFSFTKYIDLGNDSYDPAKILGNKSNSSYNFYNEHSTINLWFSDFNMPIGIGFKYKMFALKTGIAIKTTLGGEARDLNREGTFLDKIVVDSHNFPQIPFFAEIGFHFRKFKNLDSKK